MGEKRRYWTGTRKAPAQDKFFIEALDPDLWAAGDKEHWDACWQTGMPPPAVFKTMKPGQTINHIPGNNALTVKSMLYETLRSAQQRLTDPARRKQYSFFPRSYLLPGDYHALQREAFDKPEKKWIAKPKRLSRGRGISVHRDAATVPNDSKWLVQEYLSDAHLYDGFKYVLRCYVLVSSVEPLRVYLYKDGFVKLASEPYVHGNYNNLYAHLTNPDVNALNESAEASVVFHSFDTYRDGLTAQGADAQALFDGVREIAALTAIAAREQMRSRIASSGANGAGFYELIGLDCMVDNDLKPWLLECNLSPSLEVCAEPGRGGDYEAATKRALVADLVSLIGLNEPESRTPATADLDQMIATATREAENAGGFDRIFPGSDVVDLLPFFPVPRYGDILLANNLSKKPLPEFTLRPSRLEEHIIDGELALFSSESGHFKAPNEARAFIWLRAAAGISPATIINELASLSDADVAQRHALAKTVWDAIADWTQQGLLIAGGGAHATPVSDPPPSQDWVAEDYIAVGGKTLRLRFGAREIAPRLEPVITHLKIAPAADADELFFLCGKIGYAIAAGPNLVRSGLKLSELAGILCDMLLERHAAAAPDQICLRASLYDGPGAPVLFASHAAGAWDSLALAFTGSQKGKLRSGAASLTTPGKAIPLFAPNRIEETAAASLHLPDPIITGPLHEWNKSVRGYFIPYQDEIADDKAVDVRAVILPIYEAQKRHVDIRPLTGRDALLAVNGLLCNPCSSSGAAQQLIEWHLTVEFYEVHFNDAATAAKALANLLRR